MVCEKRYTRYLTSNLTNILYKFELFRVRGGSNFYIFIDVVPDFPDWLVIPCVHVVGPLFFLYNSNYSSYILFDVVYDIGIIGSLDWDVASYLAQVNLIIVLFVLYFGVPLFSHWTVCTFDKHKFLAVSAWDFVDPLFFHVELRFCGGWNVEAFCYVHLKKSFGF